MKVAIVLVVAVLAVAFAKPVEDKLPFYQILKSVYDQQPDGTYHSSFETENGIKRSENGELRTVKDEENKDSVVLVMRGEYSYPGPDGKLITLQWVADENGFQALGDHIPKVQ